MLRHATGDLHAELEQLVEEARFFESVPSYGRYLQRLHLFYRNFVAGAGHSGGALIDVWRVRERVGWLGQDLAALALAPLPLQRSPIVCPAPTARDGNGSLFGSLYVILGASLGARLLIERTRMLPLPAEGGRIYLSQVGTTTPWNRFIDALETEPISCADSMSQGAVDTFASIRRHLCGVEVP